jgi:hypothetical protein
MAHTDKDLVAALSYISSCKGGVSVVAYACILTGEDEYSAVQYANAQLIFRDLRDQNCICQAGEAQNERPPFVLTPTGHQRLGAYTQKVA